MSLPSGLIFFLDFTFSPDGGAMPRLGNAANTSIYGQGRVASEITGGVILTGVNAETGPYGLNNGFASPTGSIAAATLATIGVASGSVTTGSTLVFDGSLTGYDAQSLLRFDADIPSGSAFAVARIDKSVLTSAEFDFDNYVGLTLRGLNADDLQVRRLTRDDEYVTSTPRVLVVVTSETRTSTQLSASLAAATADIPIADNFNNGGSIGSVVGATEWGLEGEANIPEIDIKVDSVSVTAMTKKLKAKWTPELGQDLNAYHNMDAEVELTSILSEQVALEIDREILEDLVKGATAGTYYWSRRPGKFVNRTTGADISTTANESLFGADFTGNVSEWYETLIETINDVSAQIHRKTLRGGANFIVVSPEMANILEFTSGFRASVTHDDDRGTVGAVKVGSISKKFDVYVDPYFLRNVVLVGRRGASFLESGYVYAPYVPLQVTPTIFGVEDFVPRKGVMTRYAKKMVRPDMYGLVVCKDFLG
jgi:hypothetical protein